MNESTRHDKMLGFMADNGIWQLGHPRIRIFAERVCPDRLHCEINAWQHILDLIYSESVQRNIFSAFFETLSAPVSSGVSCVSGEEELASMTNAGSANGSTCSIDPETNDSALLNVSVAGLKEKV